MHFQYRTCITVGSKINKLTGSLKRFINDKLADNKNMNKNGYSEEALHVTNIKKVECAVTTKN
jgi:hypothetical protein